jgi:hypothetical protein
MIHFKESKFRLMQMKALDYVSIKSEIGNYTNFKPIALNLSCQKM